MADLKEDIRSRITKGLGKLNVHLSPGIIYYICVATITGIETIHMWYTQQYDDRIVLKYRVKLTRWPLPVFKNPGDVHSLADLQMLQDALKGGICYWVRLSNQEWQEERQRLENEVAEGRRERLKWTGTSSQASYSRKRKGKGIESAKKKARCTSVMTNMSDASSGNNNNDDNATNDDNND